MEPSKPSKKSKRISLSHRKQQFDRDKENQPDFSDQGNQDGARLAPQTMESLVNHTKKEYANFVM